MFTLSSLKPMSYKQGPPLPVGLAAYLPHGGLWPWVKVAIPPNLPIPTTDPYAVCDASGNVETFNPTLASAQASAIAYAASWPGQTFYVFYNGSVVYST
jgi:hypothetical protein